MHRPRADHLCSMSPLDRPLPSEMPVFYQRYVDRVQAIDLHAALETSFTQALQTFNGITEEGSLHRYAPGKWSIRELLQHLIDCDRIFAYRSLRIARGDGTPLPGFDEDAYATASCADRHSWHDLVTEWELQRRSLHQLFRSFDGTALAHTGTANNGTISVRAMGWITAGHTLHHLQILHERYLDHGHA